MISITATPNALVLGMLRSKQLSRYQIQEMLGESHSSDHRLNALLEAMFSSHLIVREGHLYGLTTRGNAALLLLDQARNRRRVVSAEQAAPPVPEEIPYHERVLMMRSPVRGCASSADLAPQTPRPGSLRFLEFPSRFGNTLRYRDGRVTDMAGNLIGRRA